MHPETAARNVWRPRISILSLVLLTTVVGLALGLILNSQRLGARLSQAQATNNALKAELNYLDVKNPKTVVARRIKNGNPQARRWRIFLPANSRWQIGVFSGRIPLQGYDIHGATNRRNSHLPTMVELGDRIPLEGAYLEASVFNDNNQGWVIHIEGDESVVPKGGVTVDVANNVARFFEGQRAWQSIAEGADIEFRQIVYAPNKPIDLWRKAWTEAGPNPPSGHKPGFLIWIQPVSKIAN